MKAKIKSVICWPNKDKKIEQLLNSCIRYQMCTRGNPKMKPLPCKSWKPREGINVDYAGPFKGNYFLNIVDSYSKWLEVQIFP